MNRNDLVRVGDLMIVELHSIEGLATVAEAISLMRQHNVNSLSVNRRDDTDEVGLVSRLRHSRQSDCPKPGAGAGQCL